MMFGSQVPRGADFHPPALLRNGHVQTMLASNGFRRWLLRRRKRMLDADAQPVLLDVGDGVRLQGTLTRQRTGAPARGLAVLFHGWEGSVDSIYVVQTGSRLLAEGWDVFRLNFRDHGDTHHLNAGLFHSCLIGEVVAALGMAARRYQPPSTPLVLVGFSLGGNFALRAALRAPAAGIALDYALAVCPVIDPRAGLFSIESAPWMYHWYFMRNWRESLRRKQRAFPERRYFEPADLRGNLRELTRTLVERHTDFGTLENYLDGYSVAGSRLAGLAVPTTILTARDDPVIPVADFENLVLPAQVELDIAERGGHCGFLRDWRLASFTDDYIAARLDAVVRGAVSPALVRRGVS
jgi:predicted alpha/beta-fold hydrolase